MGADPWKNSLGNHVVRLAGYHRQPVNTIEVSSADRNRIALLVIPAETEPRLAHDAMMAAATRDDASTIAGLLQTGTETVAS